MMFGAYIYGDGVSYPENYQHPGQDNFLANKREAINPMYSPSLTNLSKRTEANISYLKDKLIQQDPCYAYGSEHWHRKKGPQPMFSSDYPPDRIPQWERSAGVFTNNRDMESKGWKSSHNEKETNNNDTGPVKLCYLCSTLDEHKQHLAKRGPQLKAKPKRKPRVEFVAPPPIVKKKVEEPEEKQEVLYKIIVRTGDKPNAGTGANVQIRLKGKKGHTRKKPLKKKLAVNFCFGRGTTETFHIKGPNIGELQWITVEHNGLEKKHGWYLEEVEVTNMNTQQVWAFVCKQWLSLYLGDFNVKKDLQAQVREIPDMEYEIDVYTAKEKMAGTDANVFITFYGKKGVSPKHSLKNKSKDNFERGHKDQFYVVTRDIGTLSNIKIEHDDSGSCAGWLLEKVVIRELEEPGRTYNFPCGQWLAKDEGDKCTHKMLYPVKKDKFGRDVVIGPGGKGRDRHGDKDDGEADPNQIFYEVTMVTGNIRYAGTDATIYIQMKGKLGVAREMEFRDTNGKRFEKGSTDFFRLRADDVGDIKLIHIHHDNTGMAAGWFCETVTIKRFFSKSEIADRLVNMQSELEENINRQASEVLGEDVDLIDRRRQSLQYKGSSKSRDELNESDEEKTRRKTRRGSTGGSPRRSPRRESRSPLGTISEESESEEDHRRKKGKGKAKQKKKLSYNGITIYVTDDEEEMDRRKDRRKSKKIQDSDSDSEDDRKSKHKNKGSKSRRKYDSDSDSDSPKKHKKGHKKQTRKNSSSSSSSSSSESSFDEDRTRKKKHSKSSRLGQHRDVDDADVEVTKIWKKDRIPYCDEYIFECHRWLAEDEDDRQITRVLKPKSVTTFYKMTK